MGLHSGHRERLDKKIETYGLESLELHEQIEYILFAVIPRGDTNKIAHDLLDRYHTLRGVITADPSELMEIDGIGPRAAKFISSLPKILGILDRDFENNKGYFLRDINEICEFAKTYFYTKLREAVYLISLDKNGRFLAVTQVGDGVADESHLYPSNVVRQGVKDKADKVVLVHNHPCGTLSPSCGDVILSNKLYEAFSVVGIEMVDSVIVAGRSCYSLKENGFLEKRR